MLTLVSGSDNNLIFVVTESFSSILHHLHLEERLNVICLKTDSSADHSVSRDYLFVTNARAQSDDMCKVLDDFGVIETCSYFTCRI